jgi:hypothetical protein
MAAGTFCINHANSGMRSSPCTTDLHPALGAGAQLQGRVGFCSVRRTSVLRGAWPPPNRHPSHYRRLFLGVKDPVFDYSGLASACSSWQESPNWPRPGLKLLPCRSGGLHAGSHLIRMYRTGREVRATVPSLRGPCHETPQNNTGSSSSSGGKLMSSVFIDFMRGCIQLSIQMPRYHGGERCHGVIRRHCFRLYCC